MATYEEICRAIDLFKDKANGIGHQIQLDPASQ